MMQLGVADFPVIAGTDRAPQWPDALVGSITHTKGYTAAVVAERRHFHGLGVDVETIDRVTPELWPQICTPGELALLDRLPRPQRARMGALVFSAKEAFYKCQYAVTRQWVGFSDVAIECAALQAGSGAFVVRPLKPLLIAVDSGAQQDFQLAGRFRTDGALVFTGIAIPFAQLTRESSSGEPELR